MALTPKLWAICGRAVTITVPSRPSMKKTDAMIRISRVGAAPLGPCGSAGAGVDVMAIRLAASH